MPDQDKEESEQLSPRQLARREVKQQGRRSAAAAHELMTMPAASLRRLELDPELSQGFMRAREIKSTGARRREERRLAGVLRQHELDEIEGLLSSQEQSGRADARMFQQAEAWRARLINEGEAALEQFHLQHPEQQRRVLDRMVHDARREAQHGKPKGAQKALFRHIADVLKAAAAEQD